MNSLTPLASQGLLDKIKGLPATSVLRSWERCAANGYALHADPNPMLQADLQARREQHARILQLAQPEIETLASLVASARSVVVLADETGVILQEAGCTEFLRKAEQVALQPGVSWAESLRGTNAIGTALFDAAAVRVHGEEHFLECNRVLSCHAAPIFSPRGKVIGVLDISSEATTLHAYAMGLAQICARQISNRYLDHTDARLHRLVFQRQSSLLDSVERAILLLEEDRIVGANEAALHLLGGDWSLLDAPVHDWLDGWDRMGDNPRPLHTRGGTALLGTLRPGKGPAAARPASLAAPDGAATPRPARARRLPAGAPGLPSLADDLQPSMRHALSAVNAGLAILLQGETGAGKEIFARHLHAQSQWRQGPFVAVNCGALPESLVESELFGYEAGAFTGARREGSRGRLREAHGGVLFLDEIGDMPLLLQTRLLRALQEREVQPLGSDKRIPVDFGLVSATNHDLSSMVENGAFRADLYYRLQDFDVRLPPLRERRRLREFLCQEFKRVGGADCSMMLADSALEQLAGYHWPGNYRQLHSLLRRLVALLPPGSLIQADDLPAEIRPAGGIARPAASTESAAAGIVPAAAAMPSAAGVAPPAAGIAAASALCPTLRDISDQTIERVIAESSHNISLAARKLGVHRSTLYRYLGRASARHAARRPD
ncbi:sigma-54-dependent Fis family transcriptional regulator [Pollutimonas bauzanensis]|uniref:Transcriptional regulator of acetoin/glycerol metabolism n=1 Tax=Pollutimonas bauzanensis TaxID=658167 RepID=A0A1M5MXR8_9BURK|nr:sigma-54-dependent Fis family transcriptional regulator [Pollutimonas bauzanensis]SHG82124.1 Transcriptional regulator of acetoin/glycerol metabolism [Pollutimonas bauzanensis]